MSARVFPAYGLSKVQPQRLTSVVNCRLKAELSWKRLNPLKAAGAITEIEGAKATQAISRMNKAQSEVEYIKAARELQEVVRKGVERGRRMAGVSGAAPAAPAGAPAQAQAQ